MLFQISFRPQKEIKAKLGDGRTIHSGPFFATLQYCLHMTQKRGHDTRALLIISLLCSGGFRGNSWGSMEPPPFGLDIVLRSTDDVLNGTPLSG